METSGNFLSNLPLDILFQIIESLSPLSQVYLALTEKDMLQVICPTGVFPKLPLLDHLELLSYHESASKSSYVCFRCNKLHHYDPLAVFNACGQTPRDRLPGEPNSFIVRYGYDFSRLIHGPRVSMSWDIPPWPPCGVSAEGLSGPSLQVDRQQAIMYPLDWRVGPLWLPLQWASEQRVYTFEEVCLVMNRHFHGSGLPLESLTQNYKFERWINVIDYEAMHDEVRAALNRRGLQGPGRTRAHTGAFHEAVTACFSRHAGDVLKSDKNDAQTTLYGSGQHQLEYPDWAEMLPHMLPWAFEHRTEAKIIKDELYLASSHSVIGPLISDRMFSKLIENLNFTICSHVFLSSSYKQDREVSSTNWVGSCEDCFTDFEISVLKDKEQNRWNFKLKTYHRLGACRTPLDPTWYRLSVRAGAIHFYRPFVPGEAIPAGEVLKAWNQAAVETETSTDCLSINQPQLNQYLISWQHDSQHNYPLMDPNFVGLRVIKDSSLVDAPRLAVLRQFPYRREYRGCHALLLNFDDPSRPLGSVDWNRCST
ncbi:hypothetical protein HJFPF1_04612 [Paramyrothecium foliicola]|nr:hypothetical protein HJFPF1_04612 [Paramyrothecium foliicola]